MIEEMEITQLKVFSGIIFHPRLEHMFCMQEPCVQSLSTARGDV